MEKIFGTNVLLTGQNKLPELFIMPRIYEKYDF